MLLPLCDVAAREPSSLSAARQLGRCIVIADFRVLAPTCEQSVHIKMISRFAVPVYSYYIRVKERMAGKLELKKLIRSVCRGRIFHLLSTALQTLYSFDKTVSPSYFFPSVIPTKSVQILLSRAIRSATSTQNTSPPIPKRRDQLNGAPRRRTTNPASKGDEDSSTSRTQTQICLLSTQLRKNLSLSLHT
jgi:hypothetical protein